MAPQPLTAPYRLTFRYTIATFQHKQQNLCDAVTSGDPSGFDLIGRGSLGNVGASTVADRFFDRMAPFYDPGNCTFDDWLLEHLVGTVYQFVASGSTTKVPTGTGTNGPAMGYCVSIKDTLNRRFPAYVYEGIFGTPSKQNSYASLNTSNKAFVDMFANVGGSPDARDMWNWRISRDSDGKAQRFLAVVIDSNEKLRRKRRIK